jgi:(p)ppGpp synthase/HD superfamily hydrolase
VPLRTVLHNGDHVEILTARQGRPSPAWLDYVVTGKARAHIRHYLKTLQREEAVQLGGRLLDKALSDAGSRLAGIDDAQRTELVAALRIRGWDDLLADIGLGNRIASVVAGQLTNRAAHEPAAVAATGAEAPTPLAIRGTEGVVVNYARCCRPIPGDPILGFVTAGRGIVVHTEDCPNVGRYRAHPEQWIDVQWEQGTQGVFPVTVRIEVKNQRGVLAMIAAAIAEMDANIDNVAMDERDELNATMDLTIEVRDRVHLARIMRRLRSQDSVIRLNRKKG